MSKLYELSADLKNVEMILAKDEESGQPLDQCLTNALDEIKGELSTKVCNIGAWLKNLDADCEALKLEEGRLATRRRVKENLAERLKTYILQNIKPGDKYEDTRASISTRKSKRVEIVDAGALPNEFRRQVVTVTPDKEAIKEALKAGEVKGARIVESVNLVVK